MTPLHMVLPIKTVSEANRHEHWGPRSKRVKTQRETARAHCDDAMQGHDFDCDYPLICKIVRVGKRKLDCDNLARSNKAIRDGIAESLCIDDGDSAKLLWFYAQRKGKEYSVEVSIV